MTNTNTFKQETIEALDKIAEKIPATKYITDLIKEARATNNKGVAFAATEVLEAYSQAFTECDVPPEMLADVKNEIEKELAVMSTTELKLYYTAHRLRTSNYRALAHRALESVGPILGNFQLTQVSTEQFRKLTETAADASEIN